MATTSAAIARPRVVLSARARRFWRQGGIELALLVLVVLAAWAAISSTIPRPDRYLPSPLSVVLSSGDLIFKGILPKYLGQTLWRLILGSVIGNSIGRGGGFYDRYLPHHPRIRAWGVLHSDYIFQTLPRNWTHPGDARLEGFVTDLRSQRSIPL